MWALLTSSNSLNALSRDQHALTQGALEGEKTSEAHFVSSIFCWESFMNDGRFSVGAEEQVPMHNTGGSWDMKLK